MRGHDTPTVLLGKFDGVNGFRDGANLVDLEQEAVGSLLFDGLLNLDGVRYGQVVANNLDFIADGSDDLAPVRPVILVKGIFDRDNGVLVDQLFVKGNHFVTSQNGRGILIGSRSLEVQVIGILAFHLEFTRGNIQTDRNLVEVSSSFSGFHNHLQTRFDIAGRSKSTFVTDEGSIATKLGLDDLLEVVENFASNDHGLGKVSSSSRNHKEFLEWKLVTGVLATVDDIEAGHGESVRNRVSSDFGVVLPERNSLGSGTSLTGRQRDSENSVSSHVSLVRGSIDCQHLVVNSALIGDIHAHDGFRQGTVHVSNSLGNTLSHVSASTVT
mmetsp:Transcript_9809/g.18797  ORF Transcript_9809/g.18797 Transcript_9809/m.18797 type:complete len:327 (+) Transcript_9809:301-1281(+)